MPDLFKLLNQQGTHEYYPDDEFMDYVPNDEVHGFVITKASKSLKKQLDERFGICATSERVYDEDEDGGYSDIWTPFTEGVMSGTINSSELRSTPSLLKIIDNAIWMASELEGNSRTDGDDEMAKIGLEQLRALEQFEVQMMEKNTGVPRCQCYKSQNNTTVQCQHKTKLGSKYCGVHQTCQPKLIKITDLQEYISSS
jgi:hypothetical protein